MGINDYKIDLTPSNNLSTAGYFNKIGGQSFGGNSYSTGAFTYQGQRGTLQQLQQKFPNITLSVQNGGLQAQAKDPYKVQSNDPTSQAAEVARQNALKAADIQANLVLKQAQVAQKGYQLQNESLGSDFLNIQRAGVIGLDRLRNQGYDALGQGAGQTAAMGISMSGSALDNQNYLGQQVQNSFMDYNTQLRSQLNQVNSQITQNSFATQTSQTSAAIQAESIRGLAKLQTYRPY